MKIYYRHYTQMKSKGLLCSPFFVSYCSYSGRNTRRVKEKVQIERCKSKRGVRQHDEADLCISFTLYRSQTVHHFTPLRISRSGSLRITYKGSLRITYKVSLQISLQNLSVKSLSSNLSLFKISLK